METLAIVLCVLAWLSALVGSMLAFKNPKLSLIAYGIGSGFAVGSIFVALIFTNN